MIICATKRKQTSRVIDSENARNTFTPFPVQPQQFAATVYIPIHTQPEVYRHRIDRHLHRNTTRPRPPTLTRNMHAMMYTHTHTQSKYNQNTHTADTTKKLNKHTHTRRHPSPDPIYDNPSQNTS